MGRFLHSAAKVQSRLADVHACWRTHQRAELCYVPEESAGALDDPTARERDSMSEVDAAAPPSEGDVTSSDDIIRPLLTRQRSRTGSTASSPSAKEKQSWRQFGREVTQQWTHPMGDCPYTVQGWGDCEEGLWHDCEEEGGDGEEGMLGGDCGEAALLGDYCVVGERDGDRGVGSGGVGSVGSGGAESDGAMGGVGLAEVVLNDTSGKIKTE